MTTPVSTQFDPIQYYSAMDPYAYEVDNRPLEDLENNQVSLGRAVDSVTHATKIVNMAAGMIARGYATDNMYVGSKQAVPSSFVLRINHGFLVQSADAEIGDITDYPHVGLQQSQIQFPAFSQPANGYKRCFTIQAQTIPANTPGAETISFYDYADTVNEPNTVNTEVIQYQVLQSVGDVLTSAADNFPTVTGGWVEILHVTTHGPLTDTELDIDKVVNVNFFDDGQFFEHVSDKSVWTTTISGGPLSVITGIGVDAYKAIVFADGAFQEEGTSYTVDSDSQVTFSTPWANGVKLNFIVFRGNVDVAEPSPVPGIYEFLVDTYIAAGGETIVSGISVDAGYSFVFVNGTFQTNYSVNTPTQVTFDTPLTLGDIVDFVTTLGGTAIPAGGLNGQSVHKTVTDPAWQYEVLSANVTFGTASGATTTYTAVPTGFSETTDLYNGRLIQLAGLGFTSAVPRRFTNATRNVIVNLGSLSLPVLRPGNEPLLYNDIRNGCLVQYKDTPGTPTPRLELVSPKGTTKHDSTGVVSSSGTTIILTPSNGIINVENGTTFSVVAPFTNTTPSVTFRIVQLDGLFFEKPVVRAADLTPILPGDILTGTTAVLRYEAAPLDFFILDNPAVQSYKKFTGKRQCVLTGPHDTLGNPSKYYNTTTSPATVNGSIDHSFAARLLTVDNATRDVGVLNGITVGDDIPYVSFAAGFNSSGPIDYIEQLPVSTYVNNLNTFGLAGYLGTSVSSINLETSGLVTLNFTGAHGWVAGMSVRISNMRNNSLVHLNGTYAVTAVTPTQATLYRGGHINSGAVTFVTASTNYADARFEPLMFVYANRDPLSGAVTYGTTHIRPVYANSQQVRDTNIDSMKSVLNQHVFDIQSMVMTVNSTPVQRVFIGHVLVPHTSLVISYATHCITYHYNGTSKNRFQVTGLERRTVGDSALTPVRVNVITSGMGTENYTLKAGLSNAIVSGFGGASPLNVESVPALIPSDTVAFFTNATFDGYNLIYDSTVTAPSRINENGFKEVIDTGTEWWLYVELNRTF